MFSDPISITPNGGSAISMARVSTVSSRNGTTSTYMSSDKLTRLELSNRQFTKGNQARVVVNWKWFFRKTATDPTAVTPDWYEANQSGQFDVPLVGFTNAENVANMLGLQAWATSTVLTNLLGLQT